MMCSILAGKGLAGKWGVLATFGRSINKHSRCVLSDGEFHQHENSSSATKSIKASATILQRFVMERQTTQSKKGEGCEM